MKSSKKKILIVIALLVVVCITAFCIYYGDNLQGTSEDGKWTAYSVHEPGTIDPTWEAFLVYNGDNEDEIDNIRIARTVNGEKEADDFVVEKRAKLEPNWFKRMLIGCHKSEGYLFFTFIYQRPESMNIVVSWEESGKEYTQDIVLE